MRMETSIKRMRNGIIQVTLLLEPGDYSTIDGKAPSRPGKAPKKGKKGKGPPMRNASARAILDALKRADIHGLKVRALEKVTGLRNGKLHTILDSMVSHGQIENVGWFYRLPGVVKRGRPAKS